MTNPLLHHLGGGKTKFSSTLRLTVCRVESGHITYSLKGSTSLYLLYINVVNLKYCTDEKIHVELPAITV